MMKTYVKPMIIGTEEIAESIYMASGLVAGNTEYTASAASSWGNTTHYTIAFPNGATEGWQIVLTFDGDIQKAEVYGYSGNVVGSVLTISAGEEWTRTQNAGQSFAIQVTGASKAVKLIK